PSTTLFGAVPLAAPAASVHGPAPGGPPADHRHLHAHAGDTTPLPVVPVPPQPRRADARDGDERGAGLHVLRVRLGPVDEAEPRDPPAAGAADGQRSPADRAAELPAAHAA